MTVRAMESVADDQPGASLVQSLTPETTRKAWKRPSWMIQPCARPTFLALIESAVSRTATSDDDSLLTKLRLGLHVPQFSDCQLGDDSFVDSLALTFLRRIRDSQREHLYLRPRAWRCPNVSEQEAEVVEIEESMAHKQHLFFHYIGSARKGLHFGLRRRQERSTQLPSYLLSFSEYDLGFAERYIQHKARGAKILVLSRVHSFPPAPKNAFSFTFSRALRCLEQRGVKADLILTYVNPNLGFTGGSYLAANWMPFAEEEVRYHYFDGAYITERELELLLERSAGNLTTRISFSTQPLAPLRVFAYPTNSTLRRTLLEEQPS